MRNCAYRHNVLKSFLSTVDQARRYVASINKKLVQVGIEVG